MNKSTFLFGKFKANVYVATLYQLLIALIMLWLSRLLFVVLNHDSTDVNSISECLKLGLYGLRFDLTALAYFNSLFILLRILPFRFTTSRVALRFSDWVYYVCNFLMLTTCFGDMVYYRFSGTRMRWSGLREIMADTNIGGLIGEYAAAYWWVTLIAVCSIALMVWLYKRVRIVPLAFHKTRAAIVRIFAFLLLGGLTFVAMRGRVGSGNPLNIADATWGARSARQVNVILNTPFTLLRSIGKGVGIEKLTFFSEAELASIRTSLHPGKSGEINGKNVMIIIIESGGSIFIDSLNRFDDGTGRLKRLMPFTDSLLKQSLVFERTMATGRSSNGGANAILASFPAFEPFSFMLSPYNSTPFDSPANLLKQKGYTSAFYYGCNHGSFNIDQLAHASGFDKVVDRAAYPNPDADYDHSWGIFDGPMAEYVAADLSTLSQPWIASWFTISAHTPHKVPADEDLSAYRYREAGPERGLEYTDRALQKFFDSASQQPWFNNTVFVITADHGNRDFPAGSHYDTPYIRYHIPFMIYAPDGTVESKLVNDRVVSQFDIAPTLLSLLKYPDSYIAVGSDQTEDNIESYGISFIDNRFMITGLNRVVFTNASADTIESVYDIVSDHELKHPLPADAYSGEEKRMLRWAQALLQDYTHRINEGRLTQ